MSETPTPSESEIDLSALIGETDWTNEEKAQFLLVGARLLMSRGSADVVVDEVPTKTPEEINAERLVQAEKQYNDLKKVWTERGFDIPTREELIDRLLRAQEVSERLENAQPNLAGTMGVVLVPPSDEVGWPVREPIREAQGLKAGRNKNRLLRRQRGPITDHIAPGTAPTSENSDWRVLVTRTAERGMWAGSAKAILEQENYMIDGIDTRGMGSREYAALSIQSGDKMLDKKSFTWLLKDYDNGPMCPRAMSEPVVHNPYLVAPQGQHYKFNTSPANHRGGAFRPTVEITDLPAEPITGPIAMPAAPTPETV